MKSLRLYKTLLWYSSSLRAYSSAVERVHGMDEVGVRLPVGPQKQPDFTYFDEKGSRVMMARSATKQSRRLK